MKLIGAVFKELDKITDHTYMFDILKLKCIYHCLKVNTVFIFCSPSRYKLKKF